VRGSIPALRWAARITAACAFGFGAVSEFARPPWFSAVPRISPWMWSPSRSAADNRFSTSIPTPSPRA
jgi:hypothetical protein